MGKIELLAPAKNLETCKAVINAGADAVYIGGHMFSARAFADNFSTEEITLAIDYAHLRGSKIYLTVNTLMKNEEVYAIIDYIRPVYEAGLDAVIVQDLGAFSVIKRNFPDLAIHISTQMTVTGSHFLKLLEREGADRVVLARELTIEEIKRMRKTTDVEFEAFIHGALCYSYSGQCMMSYANGKRSANRGECAGPCRLPYINESGDRKYWLSPKDIISLKNLPDIIESGINSLKIEGRMKNVKYAAGVTAVYRKYIDKYYEQGKEDYYVSEQDIDEVLDLYNRGGNTEGYFYHKKGPEMMSTLRPNHMGTLALEVIKNEKGKVLFRAMRDINAGDVFEIDRDHSFTSGRILKKNEIMTVNLPKKLPLHKGRQLFRMNNAKLESSIVEKYAMVEKKIPIDIQVYAKQNEELKIVMSHNDEVIEVQGETVRKAERAPVTKTDIETRVRKLGNTDFYADKVYVECDEGIFISVGGINKLRNLAADELKSKIIEAYRRRSNSSLETESSKSAEIRCNDNENADIKVKICAYVNKKEHLKPIVGSEKVGRIYVSHHLVENNDSVEEYLNRISCDTEIFLALPFIVREDNKKLFKSLAKKIVCSSLYDGALVRNIEELLVLSEVYRNNGCEKKLKVVTDYNVYAYNKEAYEFIKNIVPDEFAFDGTVLPEEMEKSDMRKLISDTAIDKNPRELIVYGRSVVMQSEQCIKKTQNKCNKVSDTGKIAITKFNNNDEKNKNLHYFIQSFCIYCYNIVFDRKVVTDKDYSDILDLLGNCNDLRIRYNFTTESADEVKRALDSQ